MSSTYVVCARVSSGFVAGYAVLVAGIFRSRGRGSPVGLIPSMKWRLAMGIEIQRRSGSSICEDRRIYLWGIRDVLSPKQPRSMPRTAQVIRSLREAVVPPHHSRPGGQ